MFVVRELPNLPSAPPYSKLTFPAAMQTPSGEVHLPVSFRASVCGIGLTIPLYLRLAEVSTRSSHPRSCLVSFKPRSNSGLSDLTAIHPQASSAPPKSSAPKDCTSGFLSDSPSASSSRSRSTTWPSGTQPRLSSVPFTRSSSCRARCYGPLSI